MPCTHLESAWLLKRSITGSFGQEARGKLGRCHVVLSVCCCRSALLCTGGWADCLRLTNHHVDAGREWESSRYVAA